MKKIFTTLTMAIFALSLFAQGPGNAPQQKQAHPKGHPHEHHKHHGKGPEKVTKNIPTKVAEAFYKDYPKATNTVWTKSKGSFTATFKQGLFKTTSRATYHANGTRISTDSNVAVNQFPRPGLNRRMN